MSTMRNIVRVVATLAITTQSVNAHTWVEYVRRVSSSGAFVGEPGYAMGHMNRSDPGFADTKVQVKIDDVTTNPPLCGTIGQAGYTNAAYPPITASPGEFLSLLYAENGHVSFPDLTPRGFGGGNVMIYSTSEDVKTLGINDVLYQWNTDGTGGNQKGRLVASHFLDDGICYENADASPINAERRAKYKASSILCQSAVQLPADLPTSGSTSLLWVWDWPQNPNVPGKNTTEIYTSCMTVNLQDNSDDAATSVKAFSFAKNLDISNAAIPGQISTLIEVEQRGTGTASPAPVTDVAGATNTASASAHVTGHNATSAAATSSSKGHNSGVKTVTVTADAATVTEYQTVTVEVGAGGTSRPTLTASASASATSSGLKTSVRSSAKQPGATNASVVTSVAPFLKARTTGHIRRMR